MTHNAQVKRRAKPVRLNALLATATVNKGRACGPTVAAGLWRASPELLLKHENGLLVVMVVRGSRADQLDFAVNIRKMPRVGVLEMQFCQVAHSLDFGVAANRLADVVNLLALIFSFAVCEKQHSRHRELLGRDVYRLAAWRLPDGVELCLDENSRPVPNSPADDLLAAIFRGVVCNLNKAVVLLRFCNRANRNIKGIRVTSDCATKANNVWFYERWRTHELLMANAQINRLA